jgi:hypothetical protein
LHFEAFFAEGEAKHTVALQPERRFDVFGGQLAVIIGQIVGGKGIIIATGFLQGLVVIGDMDAAAEHEVFEKMRKARFIGVFVAGACIVHNINDGHRRGFVFMHQHTEAVGQYKFLVLNHKRRC